MQDRTPFPHSFYDRPPQAAGRSLLGAVLVRVDGPAVMRGLIMETEAYHGQEDLACHARHGLTPRTRVMFGPPGRAYVYFTYGNHWMLNAVTEAEGQPSAVLVRALWPLDGLVEMEARRPRPAAPARRKPGFLPDGWTDGPGKLCQALCITGALNGADLSDPLSGLYIEPGVNVPDEAVITGPRVGIGRTPEPWLSQPWRYRIEHAWLVSRLELGRTP